jgi:hypothetical protein
MKSIRLALSLLFLSQITFSIDGNMETTKDSQKVSYQSGTPTSTPVEVAIDADNVSKIAEIARVKLDKASN